MAGFTRFAIGSCCDCSSTCDVTVTVEGCGSQVYAGVTVNAYSSEGGSLLDSETTNGSGQAVLNVGTAGTYYFTVTGISSRFDAYGASHATTCGGGFTITLSAATGYACSSACAIPIGQTLTLTDSLLGTCTLTYSGSSWSGSITYSYPGFTNETCLCFCSPSTVTVTYTLGTNLSLGYALKGLDGCPTNGGSLVTDPSTSCIGLTHTVTCPPSFNWSGSIDLLSCVACNCSFGSSTIDLLWSLYGGVPGDTAMISITE